jgi:tetratricopeptide (TPR) repeat protein
MKTKFLIVIILLTMGALLPMETTSFAFSSATLFTNNENPTVLSHNLVERQIGGGQSHQYSIELLADQFIYIDVQQLGVDITVSLFDSEGKLLIETNAPDLSYGAEPFYWVAEKPGNHKIAIKPAETGTKPGRYTIKLAEFRTVKDDDFHFLDGQQKLAQAEKLRSQGTKQGLLDSIGFYNRAIEHWQIAGQKEREGVCLNLKAFVTYYLGDTTTAIKYFTGAAAIRPRGGGKAQSVNNLAIMYRLTGETTKALEYFTEALQLSHEIGDKQAEANILNGMGNLYDGFGNKQEALSCYNQALKLSRETGSRTDEATSLHNIGSIFSALGEADKAISFFTEALPIWDEANDFYNKLATLNQIGNTYMVIREFDKALDFYFKVVEIASEKGQNKDKGITLSQIGYVFLLEDKKEKSLEYLHQSLELCIKSKYKFGESITFNRLGMVYSLLNDDSKALEYYDKAYEIAKLMGDKKLECDILFRLSATYQKAGNVDLAITQIKNAIDLSEDLRSNFSSQQLKTFYFATANNYYQLYVDLLMNLHEKEPTKGYDAQALYVHELSRARTLLEVIKEGSVDIREGVDYNLVDQERKLNTSIINKTENLFRFLKKANYSEEERAKLEREIHQLDAELEQVQAKIREVVLQKN